MNSAQNLTGLAVTTTKGTGSAKTTWTGTVVIDRQDGTALVIWTSPMTARDIDCPTSDLEVAVAPK